jgi:hypothetical protein
VGTFTVDLYGANFQSGAHVLAQGNDWSSDKPPVSYLGANHLQATLVINKVDTFNISVVNPDGQMSGTQKIQVTNAQTGGAATGTNPPGLQGPPSLQSLNATTFPAGRFTVDLYGANFQNGAHVLAQGNGWSSTQPPVTYFGTNHLQAVIDANTPSTFTIAVVNPNGQMSGTQKIQVTNASVPNTPAGQKAESGVAQTGAGSSVTVPQQGSSATAPAVQSAVPAPNAEGVTVHLYGTGFRQGAKAITQGTNFNNITSVVYMDSTHIWTTLPRNSVGSFTVTVQNPDGQSSASVPIQLSPSSASKGISSNKKGVVPTGTGAVGSPAQLSSPAQPSGAANSKHLGSGESVGGTQIGTQPGTRSPIGSVQTPAPVSSTSTLSLTPNDAPRTTVHPKLKINPDNTIGAPRTDHPVSTDAHPPAQGPAAGTVNVQQGSESRQYQKQTPSGAPTSAVKPPSSAAQQTGQPIHNSRATPGSEAHVTGVGQPPSARSGQPIVPAPKASSKQQPQQKQQQATKPSKGDPKQN